jgi:hypothetical protein
MKHGHHTIVDGVTAAFLVKDLNMNVERGTQLALMVAIMKD